MILQSVFVELEDSKSVPVSGGHKVVLLVQP